MIKKSGGGFWKKFYEEEKLFIGVLLGMGIMALILFIAFLLTLAHLSLIRG